MSDDLLLEIGTEELPASFVTHALAVMKEQGAKLLSEARLSPAGEIRTYGTPRRLALVVLGVPEHQPDRRETVMGPPWSAAFDDSGKPKPAGEGFAKKNGVAVTALKKAETPKGAYVSVDVEEKGRAAKDVLPELLATLCQRITFPKAMRWGKGGIAFGRPIHWLIGLHGSEVVPFAFAHATSGRTTRGHRFLAPRTFEVASAARYLDVLAEAHVHADLEARRERMHAALVSTATAHGGTLVEDAFLTGECASLVEEPHVVPGTIDAAFLTLPDDVIVSVMRTHQRYFAVRDATTGKLSPTYLNVVNTANAPAIIAKGNDRVLRARLKDAAFFVDEDRKRKLDERVEGLDRVVFQAKLGSLGAKIRRIGRLADRVLSNARGHAASETERTNVRLASRLAKTDLATYIVGEFPELQGSMGRFYALEQGLPSEVANAIRDHYKPAGAEDDVPSELVGACVGVADRADTLVGCFGIGLLPTGSADPFALRRAALGIVRIALEGPIDVDVRSLLAGAHVGYVDAGADTVAFAKKEEEIVAALDDFFRGRLRAFYRERFPGDVVDACLDAWDLGSVRDLDARMRAVDAFRSAPEYGSLTVAFKRAYNIAKDASKPSVEPRLLEAGPESDLHRAFEAARPRIDGAVVERRYEEALRVIATELRGPIDTFFEKVFVMVEEADVRENRLRLLRDVADSVTRIVHFHKLTP